MRRLLIAAALLMTVAVLAAPRVPTPHATIGKTASPPVIDGTLDDACWDEERPAVLTHFVDLYMNDFAPVSTSVLVAYDAQNLYIGARCEEPQMDKIRRDCHERDDPVWRDDCIEIFIDTNRDAESYVHFAINSNGAVYDERRPGDASYDADITAKGSVGDAEWTVECAIPLSDLKVQGEPGQTWGFNIGRERNPGEDKLSAWSPTYGKFLVPERFGTVTLAQKAAPVLWNLPTDAAFGPSDVQIAAGTDIAPEVSVLRNWPEKAERSWEYPTPQVQQSDERLTGLPHTWEGLYRLVDGTEYALVVQQSEGSEVLFRQAAPIHISPAPETAALAAHIAALEASVDSFGEFSGPAAEMLEEARMELQNFAEANIERQQPLAVDEWRTFQAKHASLLGQLRGLSYIVWRRSPLKGLQRTQMPDALYPPRMIELSACGNERESATFVVSNPTSETFEGRIEIGDLQFTSAAELAAADAKNLLKNGDFADVKDNIPAGWRRVQAEAAHRVETSPDGKNTFILSGPENEQASANFRQTVDLKPGTQYTLVAELSAENLGPGGGQVYVINEGWTWSTSVRPLTPTSGRREYVRTFTPPESSSYEVVLRLSSPTGGAVKFHSVKIIEGDIASSTFSSDCITMHEVLYQDLRMARTVADPIPEMDGARTLMVPPGESRQVWMNIDTAALPPGTYSGSVKITPMDTDLPAKSVPLVFEVLPVRLPERMPIAVYNWDYARDEHYVRDLVEHHNNTFLMNTHPRMSFDDDGNATGPASWSDYDKMLQVKLRHARQQGGIVLFSYGIVRDFNRRMESAHGWEFMSEPWKKAFKTWVLEFERHLRDDIGMDYDEYAVQLWDEATRQYAEMTIEAGEFMKSFAPNIRTCMDGAQSPDEVRAMDHVIDLWIPHQNVLLHRNESAELREIYGEIMENGKPVWTYTCNTNMKALEPLDYYRLKPWRVWKLGLQGTCFWAYNSWRGDPWNDFDGPIADCGTIYDGAHGPVSSRRWEATRDGREDYKCLYLLDKAAQREGEEAADRTRAFINSIVAEALAKPDDVEGFEKLRSKMLRVLEERCGANHPQLTEAPEFTLADGSITCTFETDAQTSGRLFFRVPGNAEWSSVDFVQGTKHSAEITGFPPQRDMEWYLLFWEGRGATGFDITGLSPDGWFHTAGSR